MSIKKSLNNFYGNFIKCIRGKIYTNSIMEVLMTTILSQYFSSSRCFIIVTDGYNSLQLQITSIPIVNINLQQQKFSEKSHVLFNYFGCQDFILKVDNPVSVFQDIEKEIRTHEDRFNKRKYVFIPGISENENIFEIFLTKEIRYVSDLLLTINVNDKKIKKYSLDKFFEITEHTFSFWTHKYVGLKENNKPYLLDMWFSENSSFLFNSNLFPDKVTNQEGRIVRSAIFGYAPYIIVEPHEDQTYRYMGSEMITILTFSQYHNMTLVPVINELDYWGEVWDNFSGNGLLGNLVEDKADIGGAALYTWEAMYKFLDLSKPTVRTGITCLVPAPNVAAGWLTPLYAYASLTWLAVIATYVASVFSIYYFNLMHLLSGHKNAKLERRNKRNDSLKIKMFGQALMSVAKAFVTQNVSDGEIINGQLGRFLMGLIFMTTLILSSTYQSGLATIMTIPRYENPINTLDEFVASGLSWGGTQDAWTISIENAEEEEYKKLVSRFIATSEDILRKYSLNGKFAFPLERLPWDNYAVGPYIMQDVIQNFHLMSEDFYWEQCVLMTRKNSILLPSLDTFILRVFEANLISYWQNEAATQYMDQYVQKAVKFLYHHQQEHITVKLKISHLAGAFGILCVGNLLAIFVFLTELIYYKLTQTTC